MTLPHRGYRSVTPVTLHDYKMRCRCITIGCYAALQFYIGQFRVIARVAPTGQIDFHIFLLQSGSPDGAIQMWRNFFRTPVVGD